MTLGWSGSAGATSYNVKRSTASGGPYTTVASGVTLTSYVDATVVNGTTYYYVVTAVNAGGESPKSNEVSATPQAPALLRPPSQLQAQPEGRKAIRLLWVQSSSPDITQNKIYRAESSTGPFVLRASVPASTSFLDRQAVRGRTYYYVVTATDQSGRESAYSNMASASTSPASAVASEAPAVD